MKTVSVNTAAALAARRLRARDFLDLTARDRTTGDDVRVGFWSGLTNISAYVIDPATGLSDLRTFYGVGALISISDIPAVVGLSIPEVTIHMSQLDTQVNDAVRTYDCKQARVQIFRGLYDPDTALMVDPAEGRYIGFVNDLKIVTPEAGGDGYVELTVTGNTQEFLRANPATRSQADQQIRHAGDDFFIDAATVGDWGPLQWGPKTVSAKSQPQKKGLLGLGNFLGFL